MIPRAGELLGLQAAQEAHMPDTCKVLAHTLTEDAFNDPRPGYTAGAAQACGFRSSSRREVHDQGQVVIADAEIRLAIGTSVAPLDRIQLTHRFGRALATPLTFEVIGLPAEGPSGLLVTLRSTDG